MLYASAAGTAIGLAVGVVGRRLRNRIDDAPIEIAGSMFMAYAAYLPAEAVHASGVLAAVAAGLYLGWHSGGSAFSARSRLQSQAFWETLVFLINAALFVIVGLSFHTFTAQARGPVGRLVVTGVAVVVAVIAIRLIWMEGTGWVTRLLRRAPPADEQDAPDQAGWRQRLVIGWAGMRGAITLAVLLAVPRTTDAGAPLAGRDDIIYLGFAVIIATLVEPGDDAAGARAAPAAQAEHPVGRRGRAPRARLTMTRAVLRAASRATATARRSSSTVCAPSTWRAAGAWSPATRTAERRAASPTTPTAPCAASSSPCSARRWRGCGARAGSGSGPRARSSTIWTWRTRAWASVGQPCPCATVPLRSGTSSPTRPARPGLRQPRGAGRCARRDPPPLGRAPLDRLPPGVQGPPALAADGARPPYTELFFLDEATAFAAGHRPCGECRYERLPALLRDLAERLHPEQVGADAMDDQLHAERVDPETRGQRRHPMPFGDLPDGAFVLLDERPWLVLGGELLEWTAAGYVAARRTRPATGTASWRSHHRR